MGYAYDPSQITAGGKDQMRFELGDTAVGGGADTCALADEEYGALLAGLKPGKRAWQGAKLAILDAIVFKLSYQVDTKIDALSYGLGDRAERFMALRAQVKSEMAAAAGAPSMGGGAAQKPPYFHTGMMENPRA